MSPIRRPRNRQSPTPRRSCTVLPLLAKRLILSFSLQNRSLREESRQEAFMVETISMVVCSSRPLKRLLCLGRGLSTQVPFGQREYGHKRDPNVARIFERCVVYQPAVRSSTVVWTLL